MKFSKIVFVCLIILATGFSSHALQASQNERVQESDQPSKLLVLWTSGDKEVAKNMVFMYTYNAKRNGWWETVNLLVWGASSKLLAEDQELQDYLLKMKEAGVALFACKACADIYGVSDKLSSLGIDVKYMGVPLTQYLKNKEWVTVTF